MEGRKLSRVAFTCVAMGPAAMLAWSGVKDGDAGVRVDDAGAGGTVSVPGRRSSAATPRPGGRDGGRAPWHGDRGPTRGTVAAVRPDGGVCGGDRRLRSRGVVVEAVSVVSVPPPRCCVSISSPVSLVDAECGRFSTRRLSSISRSNCQQISCIA